MPSAHVSMGACPVTGDPILPCINRRDKQIQQLKHKWTFVHTMETAVEWARGTVLPPWIWLHGSACSLYGKVSSRVCGIAGFPTQPATVPAAFPNSAALQKNTEVAGALLVQEVTINCCCHFFS